jgi:hypothetical protein
MKGRRADKAARNAAKGAGNILKAQQDAAAEPQQEPEPIESGKDKRPSWRDFYDVHEAAAFFHSFSEGEDQPEHLKELADDIAKKRVIFEPIHTASVPFEPRPFVIDGISRLDAAESRGFRVVDENGDWIGMLGSPPGARRMTVHHPGLGHEKVWDIVISLNNKRRHYTDRQRAAMAAELAKRLVQKKEPAANYSAIDEKFQRRRGRPSKGITKAREQAAKMMNVGTSSVERIQKVEREAPEKLKSIRADKLAPSKAAREIDFDKRKRKGKGKGKKELPWAHIAFKHFLRFLNQKWLSSESRERQNEAQQVFHDCLSKFCPSAPKRPKVGDHS